MKPFAINESHLTQPVSQGFLFECAKSQGASPPPPPHPHPHPTLRTLEKEWLNLTQHQSEVSMREQGPGLTRSILTPSVCVRMYKS